MINLTDKNRLSILRPEIKNIWNYNKNKTGPENFMNSSLQKAWFICNRGHEWERSIAYAKGCPYCDGKITSIEKSLFILRPDLIKEWDYEKNTFLPERIREKSSKSVFWVCQKNHKWEDTVYHRVDGRGCPFCSNHRVGEHNSLSKLNPSLAAEWNWNKNINTSPNTISPKSNKQVWWICSNLHEWRTTPANRSRGDGCPQCNKVELKDGTFLDSMAEAYVYIKLKESGFGIECGKKYGFGKYRCDFYIQKSNTYIEVTGYKENMFFGSIDFWDKYYEKIIMKKKYVEEILKANFRFIKIVLNGTQINIVRRNMK